MEIVLLDTHFYLKAVATLGFWLIQNYTTALNLKIYAQKFYKNLSFGGLQRQISPRWWRHVKVKRCVNSP
jgi:hypothetical protein